MELKTARLTLLIDPNKKAALERLCARQDRTASQVVRQLIRDYLAEHGADDIAPDVESPPAVVPSAKRPPPGSKQAARRGGKPRDEAPEPSTRAGTRRR